MIGKKLVAEVVGSEPVAGGRSRKVGVLRTDTPCVGQRGLEHTLGDCSSDDHLGKGDGDGGVDVVAVDV